MGVTGQSQRIKINSLTTQYLIKTRVSCFHIVFSFYSSDFGKVVNNICSLAKYEFISISFQETGGINPFRLYSVFLQKGEEIQYSAQSCHMSTYLGVKDYRFPSNLS